LGDFGRERLREELDRKAATRAKALNLYMVRSRALESPLPRTEVRGYTTH